jgi:hypothetical protein
VEDPVAHRITVTAPRITVTATYQANERQILAILASAGLPAPVIQNPAGSPTPAGLPYLVTSSANAASFSWKGDGGRLFYAANTGDAGWHGPRPGSPWTGPGGLGGG